jgi:hypothetical protein
MRYFLLKWGRQVMRKSRVTFDWQELEEGQALPPLSTPSHAPLSSRRGLERPFLIGGAVFLLAAVLVVSAWVVRQAQIGQAKIHEELVLAVEAETWQARNVLRATPAPASSHRGFGGIEDRTERAVYQATPAWFAPSGLGATDPDPKGQPQALVAGREKVISVEVQALQQDMAAVMVVTEVRLEDSSFEVGPATTYRQLRFYRWAGEEWQPAEPVPALWGGPQHLATVHFDFIYRSRDAHAVQAIAAELDALYQQMRRNFGLPLAPDGKRAIEVMVGAVDASRRTPSMHTANITLPSPALLHAPDFLSDAVILRQMILLQLAEQVMEEAASTHRLPLRWYPFLNAAHQWQIWDLGGPLAEWRKPVLQWLYVDLWGLGGTDLQLTDANFSLPVPIRAEAAEYCALYSVWWWQAAMVHQSLPPSCNEVDGAVPYLASSHHSNRLLDLMRNSSMYDESTGNQGRYESILTAALLDYIAATYGRAEITALWPILQEHKDWETLIPATFGVSIKEFEAGWQAYIADMTTT